MAQLIDHSRSSPIDLGPRLENRARLVGLVAGLVTASSYLIGADRNFTHDGGTTVGALIADRPFLQALGATVSYNNHPAASVIGQITWRLGGRSELALRFPGIVAIATAIGLFSWWLARRVDWSVAVVAAMLVISNPLVVANTRAVRGYSFMLLGIVASTVILLEQVDREGSGADDPSPGTGVLYSLALGLAIAGHLYGGIAVLVHVLYLVGRGNLSAHWFVRMGAGLSIGLLAYLGLLPVLIAGRGRSFDLGFPIEAAEQLAGGVWWVAVPLWIIAAWAFLARNDREVVLPAAGVLVCLAGLWLVMQPSDLYPRMVIFMVFPFAAYASVGLHRLGPWAVAVGFVVAGASLLPQLDNWSRDEMANERAAQIVGVVNENGGSTCLVGWSAWSVWAYDTTPELLHTVDELATCDLVVGAESAKVEEALGRLELRMDHSETLDGLRVMRLYWSAEFDDVVRTALVDSADS